MRDLRHRPSIAKYFISATDVFFKYSKFYLAQCLEHCRLDLSVRVVNTSPGQ